MLLCEVALGTCYEKYNANYITSLPSGMHSTHGVGQYTPDPKSYITREDGTVIPLGKLVKRQNFSGSLNYDEFIIYDQINYELNIYLLLVLNYKSKQSLHVALYLSVPPITISCISFVILLL